MRAARPERVRDREAGLVARLFDVLSTCTMQETTGFPIVLTAPLTETIDHAGYFIQMGLASMPAWMEFAIDQKYPGWKNVPSLADGTSAVAPSGLRVVEAVLKREFGEDQVAVCYPHQFAQFVGSQTRVVGVSTHNPLGTTFAAGVYASIFGSSREPINAKYSKDLFQALKAHPRRAQFQVVAGGSGGWQIAENNLFEELSVDCVVDGRAEAADTIALFHRALALEKLPPTFTSAHPTRVEELVVPRTRTSFGVIEMTTGCGRRCNFCLPDLNPQLSIPKAEIMAAVKANVALGNNQVSLASEDMFVWGANSKQPFFIPQREALLDLYGEIAATPGVRHVVLSHATIAPAVVDPDLIAGLSDILLDKSPLKVPQVSSHPEGRILSPLIGLETGSARIAAKIMAGKSLPFPVHHWPSVVLQGLEILNRNNWFPVMTLIVGAPDETDEDTAATIDLLFEMERRGLYAFLVPSVFTPLHDTRMQDKVGVQHARDLSKLQWQLIMKSWRMTAAIGLQSWWGATAWSVGSLVMWAAKLRRMNGPAFTWPLFNFSGAVPDAWLYKYGGLHRGRPVRTLSREELLGLVRADWRSLMAAEPPADLDSLEASA